MEAKGNLRKNTRKEKDSHPDLTGKWTDQSGQQFWLSAWRNVADDGSVWFSLKLGKPVEERGQQMAPAQPVRQLRTEPDDDIPF